MTRTDKIFIIVIIAFSMVCLAAGDLSSFAEEPQNAVIKVEGEVVQIIDLSAHDASEQISVKGPHGVSVVQIEKGRIRMISSPCPDKLCVNQGWAEKPGQAIVCVPNQISISVEGEGGLDAIIR